MPAYHSTPRFAVAIPNGAYTQYSGHLAGLAGAAQADPQETLPATPADDRVEQRADIRAGLLHQIVQAQTQTLFKAEDIFAGNLRSGQEVDA